MLVILYGLFLVLPVVMPGFGNSLVGFLLRLHTVHQRHYLHIGCINRSQHITHPFVRFAADIKKHITILYRQDILRRRLIAMHFGARLQQHRYACLLAAQLPGKIVQRKNGGNHPQRSVGLLHLPRSAAANQRRQQHCKK